jgi:ubiquinone/menaquinone biosynthesis C-methylase UbiE
MSLFSDPKKNIEQCGIQPGMVIADLGAGSGFYSIEAGKALCGSGTVYAVDAQPGLLERLKNNARKENLTNVEVIWGDIEKIGGTKIRDSVVNLAMVCNVLFQIEDKKTALQEIKRILVPGGRVLVVDWSDSFGGIGPHKNSVVDKLIAESLFENAGFAKEREFQAGSHHYGFIFKKL